MRQEIDVVETKEVLGSTCCVWAGIILLEQEVTVPLEKWHHMGLEELDDIAASFDAISTTKTHILEEHWAHSLIQADCAPTMTLTPPHLLCRMMLASANRSPRLLQIFIRPSELSTQKRFSSENRTLLHSLRRQLTCCWAHARR